MSELRKISRREFMQRTGQAGGGLVFALTFASGCTPADEAVVPAARELASVAPNVYVNIRNDGIVEIYCHRSEMGQGIRTSLPQVIADELEADWDKIELIQAIGHEKYGDQNTDGSTSIRRHFDLLRNAGATARDMMIAAAASTWGVPADECVAREHAVHHAASGQSLRSSHVQHPNRITGLQPNRKIERSDLPGVGQLHSVAPISLSTSSAVFGIGGPNTLCPSAVTRTSSSIRTPPKPL